MVCIQIMGNDATIGFAGSQGHFELNVYKPLLSYNILQSLQLLGDSCNSFANNCVRGLKANEVEIKKHLDNSLMLVTALAPKIGYDNATKIAKNAHKNNTTLKTEAIKSGLVNEVEFTKIVNPKNMI